MRFDKQEGVLGGIDNSSKSSPRGRKYSWVAQRQSTRLLTEVS